MGKPRHKKRHKNKNYFLLSDELINAKIKKLEEILFINNYIRYGESNLEFGGWPISSDVGVKLIKDITNEGYSAILEFGSGSSTVVINKIAEEKKIPCLSVEHEEVYFQRSKKCLSQFSLPTDYLVLCDLKGIELDGDQYVFYDCLDKLLEWKSTLLEKDSRRKILLFVDGPPAKTCFLARYPALLIVCKVFIGWDVHVLLDDFKRPEEKEIAKKWKTKFGSSISLWIENYKFEKGLLSFEIKN